MSQFKNFIDDSFKHGICPIRWKDNPLSQLVDLSAPNATECYKPDTAPDSISDYIAHLIHFSQLLENKDPDTVAEWRGMLCEIFYSGLIAGGTVTIKCWEDLNNTSVLSKLFVERFNTNNKHTGYDDKTKCDEFCRFEKNGKPFAMLVPGVVILPLRNFDKTMFNASQWYNRDTQKWDKDKILNFFRGENTAEVDMFISWLLGIQKKCGNTAKQPLNDFIEDIKGDRTDNPEPVQGDDLLAVLKCGYAPRRIIDGVLGYDGKFFNDKILCFKSYSTNPIDSEDFNESSTNAWDRYKLDTNGALLTPIKLSNFCRDDSPVYVIPPFNDTFLNAVKKQTVTNFKWSVSIPATSVDATEIKISITFDFNNKTHTLQAEFGLDKIVVADDLPYISMWPFVAAVNDAPEWGEYFIGVGVANKTSNSIPPEYNGIDNKAQNELIQKLDFEKVKISVFGETKDIKEYSVESYPLKSNNDCSKFTMIKTNQFPEFIKLSDTEGTALGCWQIDKSRAIQLHSIDDKEGIIGFDFATTATVEALSIDGNPGFIEGPGAYLYDVFNPFYTDDGESKSTWKMVQDYYFFGSNDAKFKKILSYGQVNKAKKGGEKIFATTNYVTGRPVFVDNMYIFYNIQRNANDVLGYSAIKTPVKWPEKDGNDEKATNNFVLGCLTWGLLAARKLGCSKVKINLSLPLGKKTGTIVNVMEKLAPTLKEISGYGENLTYCIYSEAGANAKYLIEGSNRVDAAGQVWHQNTIPNPERGFMLVDLGGGTTDICVCQYDDLNLKFAEKIKCETSFKYAGRELVDISLLLNPAFRTMWKAKQNDVVGEAIVKKFGSCSERLINDNLDPIMAKGQTDLEQAIAFVSFILDNLIPTESAQQNARGEFNDIKYKYLAFFWVLGRYLRHIKDAKVVEIDETKSFKIYLTGCASKGIKTFCTPSDHGFIEKCVTAAYAGFHFGDAEGNIPSNCFITIEVLAGEEKKEVAYGLTAFDTVQDALKDRDDGSSISAYKSFGPGFFGNVSKKETEGKPAGEDETVIVHAEKSTLKDGDVTIDEEGRKHCKEYLETIFCVVSNLMGNENLKYDDGSDKLVGYIDNPVFRSHISPYISDKYIYEELLALFCFEKYCDSKGGSSN